MDMTHTISLNTQTKVICSAIQTVLLSNEIHVAQMPRQDEKGRVYPGIPHPVAIGDTVITVGVNPLNPNKLGKMLRLETPIQAEISRRLGVTGLSDHPLSVTLSAKNSMLIVEVTRIDPALLVWKDLESARNGNILLGRDKMKQPHALDLDRASPGVLVVGASRSGKTNIMRLLTAQIAGLYETHLVNMKGGARDWKDFDSAVDSTAFTVEDASRTLDYIEGKIRSRNRMEESTDKKIVLVWDEAAQPHTPEELQVRLGALSQIAGSSNIFLIVGTQTAGKEVHKAVRDNLTNRLVFQASSALMANQNSNIIGSGAEKLLKHELLLVIEKFPERMSVPRADPGDIDDLIKFARYKRQGPAIRKLESLQDKFSIVNTEIITMGKMLRGPWGGVWYDCVAWSAVFQARCGRMPSRTELNHIRTARRGKGPEIGQQRVDKINQAAKELVPYIQGFEVNPKRNPKKWVKQWGKSVWAK